MRQKLTILVTGATGAQGGSVAKALLANDEFNVRALTRNANSEAAIALKQAGAEIVEGTMDNVESLKKAMQGCYGVFGVTNFWEHYEKEYQHGKNLVDAVHQSGIKHFVFSTLASYNKLTNGSFSVPHFDIKGTLEEYTRQLQIPFTFTRIAFYYENFLTFFPLQKAADGTYEFGFPQGDTKLSMACVDDLGGVVSKIFDHPAEYIGRTVGVVGEDRTCAEYAAIMTKVFKRPVRYNYIPRETFASFGFPGAEELANMFEVQRLYIPNRQLDLIESYGLNPNMQPFESWLMKNKHKFPFAAEKEVLQVAE